MATATTTYSSHPHSHSSPRRSHMPASPTSPSAATTMAYRIKLAEMEVLLQQAQRDLAAAKAEVNAQDALNIKRRSLTSSSNSNSNTARRSSVILDNEVDYENRRHKQDDLEKRPTTSYKSYNERARLDGAKERDISTTGLKSAKKLPHPPPRPQTAPSTSNDTVPTFANSIASTFTEKSVLKGSARSRRHRSHKNRLAKFSPNSETVPEESELSADPYYASDNDSVEDDPDADRYSLSSLSGLSEADHSVKPSKSRPQSRGNAGTTTKSQSEAYVPPVPPLPTPLANGFSDQDIYYQRTQSSLSGHGPAPPSRQSTFTSTTSFSPSSASIAAPQRNPREAHAYASAANFVRQRTMDVSRQHDPLDATPPPIGRLKDNAHLRLTRSEDSQPTYIQTRTGWVTKKPAPSRDSASSSSSTLSKLRNPFAALGKLTGGRSSRNGSIASTTASLRSPSMSSSILNVTQSQPQMQRRPSTTMSFHPTSPNPQDKQQLPALKKLTLDPRALREDAALRAQALNSGRGSGAPSPALGGTMSPPLKSQMSMSNLSLARPPSAAATHSSRANVQSEKAISPVVPQVERTPTPTRLQPLSIPAPVAAPAIPKSGRPSLEMSSLPTQAPAPPAKGRPSLDLGSTISSIVNKTTRRLSSAGLPSAEKASRPSIDSLRISSPILQHKTSNISAVSALTGGGASPISGARPAFPMIGSLSPELSSPPFMLQPQSSFSSLGRAKTPAPILIGKTSFDTSVRPGTGLISPLAAHPVHLPPKSPPLPHIDTGSFMGLDGAADSANPSLSGPSGPPVRRQSEGQVSLPRPIIVRSPGSTSSIVKSPVSPLTPVNGPGMGLPSPAASYFGEPPLSGRPQHRRARSKSDTMLIDDRNGPKSPLGNITTISAAPKGPSNKLFSALKFGSTSTEKEKDRTGEREGTEKEKEKEKDARPSTRGSLYSLGAALRNSSTDLLKSFKDRDEGLENENPGSMVGPSATPPPIPLNDAVHNGAESHAGLARQGTQASLYSLAQSTTGSTSKHKRGKSEKSPGILSSIFRPRSRSSMSGPSSFSTPTSAPPALPDIKGLPYTSFTDPRPATSGPLSAPLVSTTFSIDRLPPPPLPVLKDTNTAFAGATPPPITLSKFQDNSKKHTRSKSSKLKDSPKKSKDKQITIVSVPYETSSPLKSPVHTSDRDKLLPTRNGVSGRGIVDTVPAPVHTSVGRSTQRPLDVGGEDLELGLGLGLMGMSMQDIDIGAPANQSPRANISPAEGYGRSMSLSLSVARSPSLGTVLE